MLTSSIYTIEGLFISHRRDGFACNSSSFLSAFALLKRVINQCVIALLFVMNINVIKKIKEGEEIFKLSGYEKSIGN